MSGLKLSGFESLSSSHKITRFMIWNFPIDSDFNSAKKRVGVYGDLIGMSTRDSLGTLNLKIT